MKCIACGSEALVGGTVFDSNGAKLGFNIDYTPYWKNVFGAGARNMRGYGCVHCGHLQFAVDFTEKDLQRYQQFEGEQPGVLDRINSGE